MLLFVNLVVMVVKDRKQSPMLFWCESAPAPPLRSRQANFNFRHLVFGPTTYEYSVTTSLSSRAQGLITSPANMAGMVEQLDSIIANIFSGWNIYSSALTFSIFGFIVWVIFDTQDADTHPLLLARQAVASYVRQPGESAIYRSPETPHGCMVFYSEHVLNIRD
jgi:hypothetical protein